MQKCNIAKANIKNHRILIDTKISQIWFCTNQRCADQTLPIIWPKNMRVLNMICGSTSVFPDFDIPGKHVTYINFLLQNRSTKLAVMIVKNWRFWFVQRKPIFHARYIERSEIYMKKCFLKNSQQMGYNIELNSNIVICWFIFVQTMIPVYMGLELLVPNIHVDCNEGNKEKNLKNRPLKPTYKWH